MPAQEERRRTAGAGHLWPRFAADFITTPTIRLFARQACRLSVPDAAAERRRASECYFHDAL